MELREKLAQLLKDKYGIENDADLMQELDELPGIDFGIFVNSGMEDTKSA